MPVVSPRDTPTAPNSPTRSATSITREGETGPSIASPKDEEIETSTGTPAPLASVTTSRTSSSDSFTLLPTFFRL